jgi:hypothetical protein
MLLRNVARFLRAALKPEMVGPKAKGDSKVEVKVDRVFWLRAGRRRWRWAFVGGSVMCLDLEVCDDPPTSDSDGT